MTHHHSVLCQDVCGGICIDEDLTRAMMDGKLNLHKEANAKDFWCPS